MPESLDALNELATIRARIEGIEHTQEVLVRAHAKTILAEVNERFRADPGLRNIYLLIDGTRTQKEIVSLLAQHGGAVSQPTVSRKMEILKEDLRLVEIARRTRSGDVYRKTAVDRILGISRRLQRETSLHASDDE